MAALRAQIRQDAEVRRDGQASRIPVLDLVPGDVVSLRVGDLIPADIRLLTADELECDEGVLTGESMPMAKSPATLNSSASQEQPGCGFMGTIVHQGSAAGVVVRTGAHTAFGQIAAGLAEKHSQTAFEAGLSRFSRFLFAVAAGLTAFIFIINVALSRPLIDALLFSLAIAVGIAPEMMPAIVTVSLSAGSQGAGSQEGTGEAPGRHRGPGQHRDPVHRQDRHAHRRGDHLRPGARRQRASQRSAAHARPHLQRGSDHCGRTGRRQRTRSGSVVSSRRWRRPGGRDRSRQLAAARRSALRSRAPAGLSTGHRSSWQAGPDHQGRA